MNSGAALTVTLLLLLQSIGQGQDHAWRLRYGGDVAAVGVNPLNPSTVLADDLPGALVVSYDRGVSWSELGFPGSSKHILVHPLDTLVIFCDGAGVLRSSDYGLTWVTVLPVGDVESVVIDPIHPDNLYASIFAGDIYRSTDRGINWEFISHVDSVLCSLAVRPDSANILYVGTGGTLSKSTDGGFSWRVTATTGASEVPNIAIDFSNPTVAYAAVTDDYNRVVSGVWKTTDGGEHWDPTSLMNFHAWYMDVDRSSPGAVYVATLLGDAVSRSTNEGASWDTLDQGLPETVDGSSLKVHPLDADIIWFGSYEGLYRWAPLVSTIGGMILDDETGEPVTNGFVELASTGERVMLDTSGGSYSFHYYEDDPLTTTTIHVEAFPYYLHDEPVEFIVDSLIVHNIQMTRLPQTSLTGMVEDSISHSPLSAGVMLLSTTPIGNMSYTTSTDPGGSFRIDSLYVSYPPIINYGSIVITPSFPHSHLAVTPVVLDTAVYVLDALVDTADVLITSSSGSGEFTQFYADVLDSLGLTFNFWDPGVQAVAPLRRGTEMRKGMAIYYTGNDSAPLTSDELDSLSTALQQGVHMFITGQNFIESNDSSALLSQLLGVSHAGNSTSTACKGLVGELLSGLLFNTSGGTGANNQTSRDIIQIEDSLVTPVLGYGFFGSEGVAAVRRDNIGAGARVVLFGLGFESINARTTREAVLQAIVGYLDGSILLDIADAASPQPLSYRLEQNYPNPFNPKTDVRYEISDVGFVSLVVYDILGREVATLVNERKSPGRYSVTWDASGQASGVYFYRIKAGNFTETKKLLLIR